MMLKTTHRYFTVAVSILLASLTAMSPFAIDTYLSSMPAMAREFGVNINLIEITLTIYFLGFSVGNFIGGPLSDAFGRRKIALLGMLIYGAAAGTIPLCTAVEQIWVLRFVQAFGGGFGTVTAMVFIRDWFQGKQVARLATIIGMIMMLAPLFAPMIGTALAETYGWRSIFIFMLAFAALLFVLFGMLVPESRAPKLLSRSITPGQFVEKYRSFFSDKKAIYLLLTISFSSAGLFTFITSSSFAYIEFFSIPPTVFPFVFGANILFNVIISLANTVFLKWFEPEKMVRYALAAQFLAGILLVITALGDIPSFWGFFAGIVVYIGALGMIYGNSIALVLNQLPQIAGSANALIGVARFVISFLAASLPSMFFNNTLIPIGAVILGCAVFSNLFFGASQRTPSLQRIH
ncbi:MAG: multidrug effflux MFS transporter [Deltaproteobacteria bacterium]|nr:multidrug effflux MFS transporter [Deltaproteobacteria bacterium]